MKAELHEQEPTGSPSPLVVSRMSDEHVRDVMGIERRSFLTQWPANAFYQELHDNKLAYYFVGTVDARVVAYAGIWVILEDSHVTTIAVDPEYRGRRFGEVLLLRLLDEASARGASWMTLEVRESNDVAQNLYRKYGFTTVSTRKGYYSDNNENALVMWAGNLKSELYRARIERLRAQLDAS